MPSQNVSNKSTYAVPQPGRARISSTPWQKPEILHGNAVLDGIIKGKIPSTKQCGFSDGCSEELYPQKPCYIHDTQKVSALCGSICESQVSSIV
jgi:hypothetical protein